MAPSTGSDVAARYLRKLSFGVPAAKTGAAEAATTEALSEQHAEEALVKTVNVFEREAGRAPDRAERSELEQVLLQNGKEAIRRLKADGSNAVLSAGMAEALEAIVEVDGSRPSLALSEADQIDLNDPTLGQWQSVCGDYRQEISRIASAVGRIDRDGVHCGTGFVIRDGLIMTNRHVLQELAKPAGGGQWEFKGEPTITFDANPQAQRGRHFKLRRNVLLAGPDAIDPLAVDYNKLDFAILECEPDAALPPPAPLHLESDADKVAVGRPVYVVGYPAKPRHGVYQSAVLQRYFNFKYGVKRFAPGEIDRGFGNAAERSGETVFAHDCTTLGGSSGSCVVDLGNDGLLAVGLHFAGLPQQANYAHSSARLKEQLDALQVELGWRAWL